MALQWDNELKRYVSVPGTEADPTAGTIVPGIAASQQFRLGAGREFGDDWVDQPWRSRVANRRFNPMYGRYLMGYDPDVPGESFMDYLEGGTGWNINPLNYAGAGRSSINLPGGAGRWEDIVNVARSFAPDYTGAMTTTDPAYQRWADILGNEQQAQALASLATYRGPGIYGDIHARGVQRARDRWASSVAEPTSAAWLAYMADPANQLVGSGFQLDPTKRV